MSQRRVLRRLPAVMTLAMLVACSGSGNSSTSTSPASVTTAPPGGTTTAPLAASTTRAERTLVAAAFWGVSKDGRILSLDPATLAIVDDRAVVTGADAVFGSVVAAGVSVIASVIVGADEPRTYQLFRVAPGGSPEELPVGGQPCCPAAGEGQVWFADVATGDLGRLDQTTGEVVGTASVPQPGRTLAIGPQGLYVAQPDAGSLLRLDDDGTKQASANVGRINTEPAVAGDDVWVVEGSDVRALDAVTLEQSIGFDDVFASDLAVGTDAIWAATPRGLVRLDPLTGVATVWNEDELVGRQVFVDGDTVLLTDDAGQVHRGSTTAPGLTLIGKPAAELGYLSYVPAHYSDGTPAVAPGPGPSTELDVPVGVRWDEVMLPTDAARSSADRAVATDSGFVVLGDETQSNGGRPVIWMSADARTFTRADTAALSPPGSHVRLGDAASIGSVTVAVGLRGSACDPIPPPLDVWPSLCDRSDAVAWVTTDGARWQAAVDADGSFADGAVSSISDVLAYGSGFVAVGRVIRAGDDFRVVVWTSPDGTTWTKTAELTDPGGLLTAPSLAAAGDTLVLSASLVRCDTARDEGIPGFGFANPPINGRAFRSVDAVNWTTMDLVAEGLAQDQGPEVCDTDPGTPEMGGGGWTEGAVQTLGTGAAILWTGASGRFVSSDGTTWSPLPASPLDDSGSHVELAGTSANDLLDVSLGAAERSRQPLRPATWNGESWTDWSQRASSVPAFGDPIVSPYPGLRSLAVGEDAALLVGAGGDPNVAHAVAHVSRATVFVPEPPASCEPAPGADCRGVELRGLVLAGQDLHGIDFTNALLDDVDLSGADLTGATFDDAVLKRTDLSGADLSTASLQRVQAGSATFDRANLADADLTEARIGNATGTNFRGATMTGAQAVVADFSRADLRDVTLTGASFNTIDLTGAKFEGTVLDGVTWWGSTCPDGSVQPAGLDADCTGHLAG